jgi:hypothetical protein
MYTRDLPVWFLTTACKNTVISIKISVKSNYT